MKELLEQIQSIINENLNEEVTKQETLLEPLFNQVYDYFKNNTDFDLRDMLKLSQLENQLTKRIIDVKPKIEPSSNPDNDDKIIEQIIYYSRKKAESVYQCSVINDSLRARSLNFCTIVLETAKNLDVSACMFNLNNYFDIPVKHNIVIANTGNKYYLIDLTYQQFFMLGYNFKNRYYEHPSATKVCEVGGRMTDDRLKSARDMIEKGYLRLEKDIKQYFDAFMEINNSAKM